MRVSRLTAESRLTTATAMMIGSRTRIRGTPAAISAVISLCRWIQATVNMAETNASSPLVLSKKRIALYE